VTFVVDQSGGSGTYPTIGAALALVSDGDEIEVRAGSYDGPIVLDRSITLRCEGPDIVTLRHSSGDTISVERNRVVTITGCTVTGAATGVLLKQNSATIVRNNVLTSNRDGILNIEGPLEALTVENNTIAGNREDGIELVDRATGRDVTFVSYANNIIAENLGCGIDHGSGPDINSLKVLRNNAFSNQTNYCGLTAEQNAISEPPGFVSAESGDYRLLASSTSRNRGTSDAPDPDGTQNDLGAFGGPGSAGFFPSPEGGPTIRAMSLFPSSVPKGGTIQLRATGRVEAR
jgi:hypothetical protein